MLMEVYDPKHNSSVGNGARDFYYSFDKDYNNTNTMWGQVLRTKQLPQNFVQRLWDPDREYLQLDNGQIGTHKLSYKTGDAYDIIYPEIQQKITPASGYLFWKKPAKYEKGLVDLSDDREKAWRTALQYGDTIQVPFGMGEIFTKNYKQYYPGFKQGGPINYLNLFKK